MPYVLSPTVHTHLPGLWGEGEPYTTEVIYNINSSDPKSPPVQYNEHTLRPHSITHIDFPGHTIREGATAQLYFKPDRLCSFYGTTVVIRLQGAKWEQIDSELFIWRVSQEEIQEACARVTRHDTPPDKLFMTAEGVPITKDGFHDSRYILVLTEEAAQWLVSNKHFNAFGTSWKSNDFQPGSRERPIHKILFSQAVLFEQLKLDEVPEGEYWLTGFPLNLEGATESPVTPVLFRKDEL